MVDKIKKNVDVTDLGDGRFEISYKSLPNQFQRVFAFLVFFCFAPISCVNLGNHKSTGLLYFLIFAGALTLSIWLVRPITDKLELSPEALKFGGRTISWSDIDYFGTQGKEIHVICSGTRVNIGEGLNPDVATTVRDRIVDYSSKITRS